MARPISVIATSCGRGRLLYDAIGTFNHYNTYPIGDVFINDDYGSNNHTEEMIADFVFLQEKYPLINFTASSINVGQVRSYDFMMSKITTPYYFNFEDDSKFIRPGFIEKCIEIMDEDINVVQVWLMGDKYLTNLKPEETTMMTKGGVSYSYMQYRNGWGAFSFFPSVRRLSDYIPYNSIVKPTHIKYERQISSYYKNKNKKIAFLSGESAFVKPNEKTFHITKEWLQQ